jgi:hypothetical protein
MRIRGFGLSFVEESVIVLGGVRIALIVYTICCNDLGVV